MQLERPRIGVDFHVFDGKFQGSRSHLIGVFSELPRICPEFDFVFLLEKTDALGKLPGFSGPNVFRERMPYAGALKRLGWDLPRLRRLLKLDLLHTQYVMPFVPARGNAVTIHDVLFEPFPQFFSRFFVLRSRLFMRWAARRADLLFSVSEYSRREIAERYGVSARRIEVLHNAVDRSVFFPGAEAADLVRSRGLVPSGYLLTVGRIEPRKNHAGLVRAYARLQGDVPPLVIVGQRDFGYGDFEKAMAALPPKREVKVLSDVGDDELPALYRHALFFAYPSFAEGFGMPPLEAMASGVPVITSSTTAIPEVVGDAGLLVQPSDDAALQVGLEKLLASEALRRDLSERGLAQADIFQWRSSAEVLAASYRGYFEKGLA